MSTLTTKDGKPALEYQGTVRLLNAIQKQALGRVSDDMLEVNRLLQDERFINGYRKTKSKDLVELEPSFTYNKNGWLAVPTKDGTFMINDGMTPDQIAAIMSRMTDKYTIAKDYYIPAATRGINPAVADKQAEAVSKTKNAEEIMQETGMTQGKVKDLVNIMDIPMTRPTALPARRLDDMPVLTTEDESPKEVNEKERERKPAPRLPKPVGPKLKDIGMNDIRKKMETIIKKTISESKGTLTKLQELADHIIVNYYSGNAKLKKTLENIKTMDDAPTLAVTLSSFIDRSGTNNIPYDYRDNFKEQINDLLETFAKEGRGVLDEAYDKVEYQSGGNVDEIIEQAVYQGGEVQKKI